MQQERLRNEIMEEIQRLDYFNLQKLDAFIDGMKAQVKEGEGGDHEDG